MPSCAAMSRCRRTGRRSRSSAATWWCCSRRRPAAARRIGGRQRQGAKKAKATKAAKTEKPAIEKIEDLSGRRIGIIGRSKANATLLEVILKQYGIPVDKVTVETIQTDDVAPIKEGKVDAVMTVGPGGQQHHRRRNHGGDAREGAAHLPVDRRRRGDRRAQPDLRSHRNHGRRVRWLPAATGGIARYHRRLPFHRGAQGLSEQTIAEFARLLYSVRQTVATEVPAAAKIEAPETGKSSVVTVHPGAAAYIDGTQKNFFDRYSEFIYLGVMLLSFAGSASPAS